MLLWIIPFQGLAQASKKIKTWVVSYDLVYDMPNKKTTDLSKEEKQTMAIMELAKAMGGGKDGEPLLQIYANKQAIRVEQKGISRSVQISNLIDSTSFLLDSASSTAYRVPLASPKIDTRFVGDSMVVVSSQDAEIQFTDDTSHIAGFACKKAFMSIKVGKMTQNITIWYAPELPQVFWGEYDYLERIPGLALKISTETQGMDMGIVATTVKEDELDEEFFSLPPSYKVEEGFFPLSKKSAQP